MDKAKVNYLVDFVMAVTFLVLGGIGIIMLFLIPDTLPPEEQVFLGISHDTWSMLHGYAGLVVVVLVIVHVLLHLDWIVYHTKRLFLNKPT